MKMSAPSIRIRRQAVLLVIAAGVLFSGASSSLFAAGPAAEWKVGLARVKITPKHPMRMAGYAARTKPFERVEMDLYCKAMAFEDYEGGRAVLITADTLAFPGPLSEKICRRITAATGLERKAILLNSSHTHAGPMIRRRADMDLPPAETALVDAYTAELEDNAVKAAVEALAAMEPARLSWGLGVAKFVMNRRQFTERGIILGTNPRGLADRSVPVLRVGDVRGKLRAVVFQAASHNTTLTGKNLAISGDYAGFAQAWVERMYPGVQAMFMIGCAADANPYPRGTLELARRHGSELGEEVCRLLESKLKPVRGPIHTELRRVDLPLESFTRQRIEQIRKQGAGSLGFFIGHALARLDRGGTLPKVYNAPFALWQFGGDLTLVAFSGETVVDYVPLTEKTLGPLKLWIAGYSNDVFGYLPSSRILAEGGYETRGLYIDDGVFAPGVETHILPVILEMARHAGRPLDHRTAR